LIERSGCANSEICALLAKLLSLPGTRYPELDLSPRQQKDRTISAIIDQIAGLARAEPVLLLFEDAHWSDSTSRELLDLLITRIESMPALLIVTLRPHFTSTWVGQPQVTLLALARLNKRQAGTMIQRLTKDKPLRAEVLTQILAKTDGVPLFLEELTKTVLESGMLEETDSGFELKAALPPLAIPSTLHDSLMARLDKVAAVKEVAQIGSCIGREFSYQILQAVAGLPDARLHAALAELVKADRLSHRDQCLARPPRRHTSKSAPYRGSTRCRRARIAIRSRERRAHRRGRAASYAGGALPLRSASR
jgi:predicted ATPase